MKPNGKPSLELIFDFILKYKRTHDGCSPSIREIQRNCNIHSTSRVSYYLHKLAADNKIIYHADGRSRSLEVIGGKWSYDG